MNLKKTFSEKLVCLKALFVFISFFLLTTIFPLSVSAQKKDEKPSFAGAWSLAKKTEKLGTITVSTSMNLKIELDITFSDPEFKIQEVTTYYPSGETITNTSTYFTDGRGETRLMPVRISLNNSGNEKYFRAKFSTRWKKQKLVSKGVTPIKKESKSVEIIEEWELSKDGSELTHLMRQTLMVDPTVQRHAADIGGIGDGSAVGGLSFEVRHVFRKSVKQ